MVFTPVRGWALVYGRNGYSTYGIPSEAMGALSSLNDAGSEIKQVAFAADGSWVILLGSNGNWHSELP